MCHIVCTCKCHGVSMLCVTVCLHVSCVCALYRYTGNKVYPSIAHWLSSILAL